MYAARWTTASQTRSDARDRQREKSSALEDSRRRTHLSAWPSPHEGRLCWVCPHVCPCRVHQVSEGSSLFPYLLPRRVERGSAGVALPWAQLRERAG
jgi:hypothetical protein